MTVNTPRFRVTMNGTAVEGIDQVSITQAGSFDIGKFMFRKAFVQNDAFPPAFWAATANKTMAIEIELSIDGQTFTSQLVGNVDNHNWDLIANTISVTGRDLAGPMMDTRTFKSYRNQSASEIAQILATEHGLQASITKTTTLVGRYYDIDHDELSGDDFVQVTNEWDLLCRLGEKEGIIPYVFGNTLYFNPPAENPPVYQVFFTRDSNGNPVSNALNINAIRNLIVARDVIVVVRSWHSGKKSSFYSRVRTKTKTPGSDPNAMPTEYDIRVPNLTQAQCLALAQQLAKDISQHERMVQILLPSLVLLNPQYLIQLAGTGTDYDRTYNPRTITSISTDGGASTSLDVKNSSPLSLYDADTDEIIGDQA